MHLTRRMNTVPKQRAGKLGGFSSIGCTRCFGLVMRGRYVLRINSDERLSVFFKSKMSM